ncbi:MAG: histidine kinase [Rhizobacter sp.]|nr:histidine kinase [Ferruginibacter sp.]
MSTDGTTISLNNNFLLRFLVESKYRLYRHLVLILFIAAGIYNGKNDVLMEPFDTYVKLAGFILLLLMFYFNMYVLMPKLIFKNKYVEYCLSVAAVLGVLYALFLAGKALLLPYINPENVDEDFNAFSFVFIILILIIASSGVKFFQRWIADSQRINDLERTTMQSELEQLKNQINPHFLFNMLNNANVLTQKDPGKASQVLMKLSDLLRYQLYDSTRNKVLLTADIHFLEDFLNLEKVRRDNFEFFVSKEGELNGLQVSPLLFITFVENAVKHNMDGEKQSYVHLFFNRQRDELVFKCINSKPLPAVAKNGAGGLGLSNVKRRLELLYPKNHTLVIEDKANTYSVTLIIKT